MFGSLCGRFAIAATLLGVVFLGDAGSHQAAAGTPAPAPCSVEHLSFSVGLLPNHSASMRGLVILVRNGRSRQACVLAGYPHVVLERSGVAVVAAHEPTFIGGFFDKGTPPPPVVLRPRQSAQAYLSANPPVRASSGCAHGHYRSIAVSLPGSRTWRRLSATRWHEIAMFPGCMDAAVTPFLKEPVVGTS
jgi:hypothetical protein